LPPTRVLEDDAPYELWEGVDQPPADDPIAHAIYIPVSAAVLAQLLRVGWAWAIVYVQQGLVLGTVGAAAGAAYQAGSPYALLPIAPLGVAAIWIDARLLGRLAWYLTGRDQTDRSCGTGTNPA